VLEFIADSHFFKRKSLQGGRRAEHHQKINIPRVALMCTQVQQKFRKLDSTFLSFLVVVTISPSHTCTTTIAVSFLSFFLFQALHHTRFTVHISIVKHDNFFYICLKNCSALILCLLIQVFESFNSSFKVLLSLGVLSPTTTFCFLSFLALPYFSVSLFAPQTFSVS